MTIALGGALRIAGPATVTSEAAGQVVVTVERAGDTLAAARVGYRTADGTAVAGVGLREHGGHARVRGR